MVDIIRQATLTDLEKIAKVHIQCFPDSFSTVLGRDHGYRLLSSYYKEYMDGKPELFLVSESDGEINGFCMGYLVGRQDYSKSYIKHNAIGLTAQMIKLLLSGNKAARDKVKSLVKKNDDICYLDKSFDRVQANEKVDLLSICVLPAARGSGTANVLIKEFENRGKLLGRDYCVLTVKTNNDRAIRFYEKNGFVLRKKTKDKMSLIKKL